MGKWRRRTAAYLGALVVVILLYTVAYHEAMAAFEGREQSFAHSLQVVVETFTTTGFGSDAPWSTTEMNLIVVAMDLTGVLLIFMALPAFVFPLFEETLSTTVPTSVDGLADHVVICGHTPRGRVLREELRARDVPYLFVVDDDDEAGRIYDDGEEHVIHGDPEEVGTLHDANVAEARALVADADDETNASVVLSARECVDDGDLRVVSLVEDEDVADYHRYAGADRVVSPRRLLGESLGAKATASVADELGDGVEIGEDFQIAELLVHRGSPLVGESVVGSSIGDRTGANVLGAWKDGEFESPPRPDRVIDEHTVLLVVGTESELEELKDLTLSETRRRRRGPVVVAGYGRVGHSAAAEVRPSEEVVVVDEHDAPGVDVVGDATDRETLEAAGVDEARAVVIALDSDTTTIFATLAVKQVAPHAEVIARANDADSVPKLYRAGADYVLSLSTVSGRLIASHLLDEEVLRPETQVDLIRTVAPRLEGRTLAGADVRAETGVTIVAVERDGALLTNVGPDTKVIEGDRLVVAGTDDAVNRFNERFV
ncbi:TrkA family potassium uptake protein [Halobaculum sp. WSA2]|uniref:TrkA family potassium uptake protein n=1 Tax=Halobaculum saliterrae TaxID=2073113 RepID=A0A6B0SWX0_9EURY|nr:NAD-binding protein [Halobaculum saliterrae]MXR42026.1 TrkA family potassium uptake protein [Halobaculum saliterrae]